MQFIKLINSAAENARHRYDDIDANDMFITHCAAHRGTIKRDGSQEHKVGLLPKPLSSKS